MNKKLSSMIAVLECKVHGPVDTAVKGITYDSRAVKPGDLFIALSGKHNNGKNFISEALAKGAVAVVSDEYRQMDGATLLVVKDTLQAMAALSADFYGHPDRQLLLVGVTGTNGKTTITYFLESILENAGLPTGVMGTVNYRYGKTSYPAANTTPQSADVYRFMGELVKDRRKAAVMEVSSHALSLGRVEGLEFDIAIFTNLTRDHLDFHQTMENYFEAKASLFAGLADGTKNRQKFAIINTDDPWGRKLLERTIRAKTITYGIKQKAEVFAEAPHISSRGTEFTLITPLGNKKVRLSHLGQHNVYNALAAAAAALGAGLPLDKVVEGLEKATAVPGRLERVEAGQNYTVVVDFAHTDDALHNVLTALRELKPARIITIFGCGGDRDRSKRPLMGDIASELSDYVIVTSDNPRSEQPEKIALDIEVGIRRKHRNNYQVLLDREQAIAQAISMAMKGDIVLIAGKGHETYQILGDRRIHFNDTETALRFVKKKLEDDARLLSTDAARLSPQSEFNF
jgi:UDP-N-acetylmuramoyl-L-alanyl-D-glutamate--2,6-diaminopimelate ligase